MPFSCRGISRRPRHFFIKVWIGFQESAPDFLSRLGRDRHRPTRIKAWVRNALSQENLTEARRHSHESLRLHDEFGNKIGITWCLATLAGVATRDEDPERGAQLWGASEAFREQIGCRIASASRLNRERTLVLLRQELGKAHFEAQAATGRALSLEQAIALAIDLT